MLEKGAKAEGYEKVSTGHMAINSVDQDDRPACQQTGFCFQGCKWGQAHEGANLFVSDGSVFTTSAAENPTLTIVALAIRQAEHIAAEMEKGTL